jgi:hypothetical protein
MTTIPEFKTSTEAAKAWREANSENKTRIYPIWASISLKEIQHVTTLDQALVVYRTSPGLSVAKDQGFNLCTKLSVEEVKNAVTAEDAETAWRRTLPLSPARDLAYKHWENLCATPLLARQMCERAYSLSIWLKWNQLSYEQVKSATTLEESIIAHDESPENSRTRELALIKCCEQILMRLESVKDLIVAEQLLSEIDHNSPIKKILVREIERKFRLR